MLRFGIISEFDSSKGAGVVFFEEDKIVTGWLPLIMKGTFNNQYANWLDVGEHVACMMDENCEDGVILGAIYSEQSLPTNGGQDQTGVSFGNGKSFLFDRATGRMEIRSGDYYYLAESGRSQTQVGNAIFEMKDNKFKIANSSQELSSILSDLIDAIAAITVGTPSGNSTAPLNAVAINLIKTRINALLA